MNEGINRPPNEEIDELESLGVPQGRGNANSIIQWLRKYLKHVEPEMLMIHAVVMFIASVILAFIAAQSVKGDTLNLNGALFWGTVSTFVRVIAATLVAWAVGRLIADAIKDGAKS